MRTINIDTVNYETEFHKKYEKKEKYNPGDPKKILALIPGIVTDVFVKSGQKVKRGDNLLSFEAMKMNNFITANMDGKIKEVYISKGEKIVKKQLLIEFE
jgi:pyruvate carboxylase